MKNKQGQFFVGGLIDASTLPKWILYPLLILVCLILLFAILFMGTFAYTCLVKDKCMMPFGYWGMWGMPIIYGGGISISDEHCSINGRVVNCSELSSNNYEQPKCCYPIDCPQAKDNPTKCDCVYAIYCSK